MQRASIPLKKTQFSNYGTCQKVISPHCAVVPQQLHPTSFLHACAQALAARFPSSAPPDKPEAGPEGDPEAPPPEPGPEDEPGEEEAGLPGWGGFSVLSSSSSSTDVRRRRSSGRSRDRAERLDIN